MWGLCAILTLTEVFEAEDEARTDRNLDLLKNADWFRVPYPCKLTFVLYTITTRYTILNTTQ